MKLSARGTYSKQRGMHNGLRRSSSSSQDSGATTTYAEQFSTRMLPSYSPILNPCEQAHRAFNQHVKNRLAENRVQVELRDTANARGAVSLLAWRCAILERLGEEALNAITQVKCLNWSGRIYRYMNNCLMGQPIVD